MHVSRRTLEGRNNFVIKGTPQVTKSVTGTGEGRPQTFYKPVSLRDVFRVDLRTEAGTKTEVETNGDESETQPHSTE